MHYISSSVVNLSCLYNVNALLLIYCCTYDQNVIRCVCATNNTSIISHNCAQCCNALK